MTELRKKILNSIYKKEEKNVNRVINDNKVQLEKLKSQHDILEEKLEMFLKYNVYDEDIETLRELKKLIKEYHNLKSDKIFNYLLDFGMGSAAVFASSLFGEFDILGYCIVYPFSYYRDIKLNQTGNLYDSKKYKLVKNQMKKGLLDYNVLKQQYNHEEVKKFLDEELSYTLDEIRSYNDEINKLRKSLEQNKILLFNTKIAYIDGEFKPLFDNSRNAKKYYSSLGLNDKPKLIPINGKVKTLKKTITIK